MISILYCQLVCEVNQKQLFHKLYPFLSSPRRTTVEIGCVKSHCINYVSLLEDNTKLMQLITAAKLRCALLVYFFFVFNISNMFILYLL